MSRTIVSVYGSARDYVCERSSRPILARRLGIEERPLAQFLERLAELLLRVHHDRAVPGDGLLERLSRDEKEPNPVVAGLHLDLVAAVEEHERAVVRFGRGRRDPLEVR